MQMSGTSLFFRVVCDPLPSLSALHDTLSLHGGAFICVSVSLCARARVCVCVCACVCVRVCVRVSSLRAGTWSLTTFKVFELSILPSMVLSKQTDAHAHNHNHHNHNHSERTSGKWTALHLMVSLCSVFKKWYVCCKVFFFPPPFFGSE